MTHLRTVVEVPKMDCPSEERLIRLALNDVPEVESLEFDLSSRRVTVSHRGSETMVLRHLEPLGLGARLAGASAGPARRQASLGDESRVLWLVLAINAVMFAVEAIVGWIAASTGLLADSLDMLADAGVYGLSLYAVGRSGELQRRAARVSGLLQGALALGVGAEVVKRWLWGGEPSSTLMIAISALALIANLACLALLHKHRDGAVHMRASWIFTSADVLANLGVIIAGALVALLDSRVPDLVIGAIIAVIVLRSAVRILSLSRARTT